MALPWKNFLDASLHPPAHDHQPPDVVGAPGSWAMLDVQAYIADRRNATTAYSRMSNGAEIQVIFCVAPPPAVSYLCVWCPDKADLTTMATEPRIIAAEADLVALRVGLGYRFQCGDPQFNDIFIYRAGGGGENGPPSLRLIPLDDVYPYCVHFNAGLLRRHCSSSSSDHDDDSYHIVGLTHADLPWLFILHLFDPETASWSSRRLSVQGRKHRHSQFRHSTTKVITLGQKGLMGFVDLWRGILVCDVLEDSNGLLHYIPLPRFLRDNKKPLQDPVLSRDIVAVQGRIKVVDCFYCFASGGWKATVWSRRAAATSLDEEDWNRDCKFEIRDVLVDSNTLHFELLPEPPQNDGGRRLDGLDIVHPTLSLNDDHTVYFMAKIDLWDKRAWVLAVDVAHKRLQNVGIFPAQRSLGVSLSYIHSRISEYFKTTPGK